MFYTGTLQDGIALAVQEKRLVGCFIRQDDNEECQTWERDWFRQSSSSQPDKTLGDMLAERAVLLRIDHQSQEASHLAAFCTFDRVPVFVVISNGRVVEHIESGVSRDDFSTRLQALFQANTEKASASTSHTANVTDAPAEVSPVPQPTSNAAVQSLLAERAVRLEKERKRRQQAEKEARSKKRTDEKATASAAASTANPPDPVARSRRDWLQEQAKRKEEAKADRERVLRMIESDKAERREREARRRLVARGEVPPDTEVKTDKIHEVVPTDSTCAIQIRLFDGSSLRTRFGLDETVSDAVRAYVTEHSQTDIPYTFRQMRTPQPSRTIDVAEEAQTLQDLDLYPSATLVLVPVSGYIDAYAEDSGFLAKGVNLGYSLISGALGLLGGVASRVTGYARTVEATPRVPGDESEPSEVAAAESSGQAPTVKIRTLADQRAEAENTELYNGNQLNFEPRKDDDKDERK